MEPSCIPHPPGDPFAIIRTWAVEACEGDHCAAALLNFFEQWHNTKLKNLTQARSLNDVAEKHGDTRAQDESLLQWHTMDELTTGVIHLYGKNVVLSAVKRLRRLGFVTVHKNPNPSYKWDKTHHYRFHPEIVIAWLRANRGIDGDSNPTSPVKSDGLFLNSRSFKNKPSIVEKGTMESLKITDGEFKNNQAIPKNTPENSSKDLEITHVISSSSETEDGAEVVTVQSVFEGWNAICGGEGLMPKKRSLNPALIKQVKLRIKEHPEKTFWEVVFNYCLQTPHYRGENDRHWAVEFDWLMKNEGNCMRLYERGMHELEKGHPAG